MKIILTVQEIIAKFGFPVDAEIELSTENEWVSNIGHSIWRHPKSLSADTKVEVKTRCGNKYSGIASDWNLSWIEVGDEDAIVAYRILKD